MIKQEQLDKIDEGMVDKIVDVARYNLFIKDIGVAVVFEFKFPFTNTKLDLRVKKDTLYKVFDYIDEIKEKIHYKR